MLKDHFLRHHCCVVIPTYNNAGTLEQVIKNCLDMATPIIVINDGATDSTAEILSSFSDRIHVITHSQNLGKGKALRNGFAQARALGYEYAISIDSDGQHFPSDFEVFLNALDHHKGALLIGARNMNSENVPGGSSFGNKFSNFWFRVETGLKLPDTQSGFRAYPIKALEKLNFYTSRFEFEIEVIVKAAWKGIPVLPVPVQIFYAKPGERISHFRPGKDFFRISLLNTWLVILAVCWYRPLHFLKGLSPTNIKAFIHKHFFAANESPAKKASSVAVGIFFSIIPIWGFQLVSAIAAAYLLRLNRAIVILAANISIPPFLPLILIASLKTGEWVTGQPSDFSLSTFTIEKAKENIYTYVVGACVLSVLASVGAGLLTYLYLRIKTSKLTK
jgi:glycosyltransferase involved in cell wall biosynthesis